MAHVAKYGRGSVAPMMHHYTRDRDATLARDNVDPSRTHENYVLGPGRGWDEVRSRIEAVELESGRKVRSDAVVMADWVVTKPVDVPDRDSERFFESTYRFLEERYGAENMLGGWVHRDEATPHMHAAFTPIVERDDGTRAFSAKSMLGRSDLKSFHQDLSRRVERDLGYRCQVILNDERSVEKHLSPLAQRDYIQARERLERLRCGEREAGGRNRELQEELRGLRERERGLGDRAAQAEEQVAQVKERAREVERAIGRDAGRYRALEGERRRADGRERQVGRVLAGRKEEARRIREARGRSDARNRGLEAARDRLRGACERVKDQVRRLEARLRGIADRGREAARERDGREADRWRVDGRDR